MNGLGQNAALVQAFAVVADGDHNPAALVHGMQPHSAKRRLALRHANLRQFDAVVYGVAHHVHQRVAQLFHNVAVNFGFFTGQQQLNLLALGRRQVAHQPVHFLKGATDLHHAQRHGVALQVGGDALQLAHEAR